MAFGDDKRELQVQRATDPNFREVSNDRFPARRGIRTLLSYATIEQMTGHQKQVGNRFGVYVEQIRPARGRVDKAVPGGAWVTAGAAHVPGLSRGPEGADRDGLRVVEELKNDR